MIRLVQEGTYKLIESKKQNKILILDKYKIFAWIFAKDIGEILVASKKNHAVGSVLSVGNYRMYEVDDEPKLSDQIHLELCVGMDKWQGFLLPTGLPSETDKRNRIIPTEEIISQATKKSYISGLDE